MNIGFDAKRAFMNSTGLGQYARRLISALVAHSPKDNFTLFTPASSTFLEEVLKQHPNTKIITPKHIFLKKFHQVWRSCFLAKEIQKHDIKVFHGLSSELPLGLGQNIKKIVTIHDLIFFKKPELYSPLDAMIYRRKTKYAAKYSDKILTISYATKLDLIDLYKVPEEKIIVVPPICDAKFYNLKTDLEKQNFLSNKNLDKPFLLFLGTIEQRKNLFFVIKALFELFKNGVAISFVIVGRKGDAYVDIKKFLADKLEFEKNIMFFHDVKDEEVPLFFQTARAFVYPSQIEGFGMPLAEAAASGTAMITLDHGALKEAAGPGAFVLSDGTSGQQELEKILYKIFYENQNLDDRIALGKTHAKKFLAQVIAEESMKIYMMP